MEECNGKDLRCLNDIINQCLKALQASKQDITESFITSMLELKLDQVTMFEWQRHNQDSNNVLHYSALLNFLDLRAQASENIVCEMDHKRPVPTAKKKSYPQTPSYAESVDNLCVDSKLGSHPLYACKNWKIYTQTNAKNS